MNALITLIIIIAVCFFVLFLKKKRFEARRKHLMNRAFPPEWEDILHRNVSLYKYLPQEVKKEYHSDIQVFLNEKYFEGCGGLTITEEIKVTVAGQACILLLNRHNYYYPNLTSILVYPSAFVAKETVRQGAGIYTNQASVRIGESSRQGMVVLAWDHVKRGALDIDDGQNVTLHEFAHQLDQEGGPADGMPILEHSSGYKAWATIICTEYEDLQKHVRKGIKTVMNKYGATNLAEFFAVATETFFEKPKQLRHKHPELYDELKNYYKLDPMNWGH